VSGFFLGFHQAQKKINNYQYVMNFYLFFIARHLPPFGGK